MNWFWYETVSIIMELAMKAQNQLRMLCRVQIVNWLRYSGLFSETSSMRKSELMRIWNSLDNNQIGDEGAKSLASALQSPTCTVTSLQCVPVKFGSQWTDHDSFTNSLNNYFLEGGLIKDAIAKRILSLNSCRARCLVTLLAGAMIERVGRQSTVFKMKIDIFRKLWTFLPLE